MQMLFRTDMMHFRILFIPMNFFDKSWFEQDSVEIARKLLGAKIEYNNCSGMIVETEAYRDDPASHAHRITPRSRIMLETHAHLYVYFIYGMYHCLNITTNKGSRGAVLIRAVEPVEGISAMEERRKTKIFRNLTSGPGKLCSAFGITRELNGKEVNGDFRISQFKKIPESEIGVSSRIGISEGKDFPWRFFITGNPCVSR